MKKWLIVLLVLLLCTVYAAAEELPLMLGWPSLDHFPKGLMYTVYTGPGEDYLIANRGKAKVSTNGEIQCHGIVNDHWALISYKTDHGYKRMGYIDISGQMDYAEDLRRIVFADEQVLLKYPIDIIDVTWVDDEKAHRLGTVYREITLLGCMNDAPNALVHVEGTLKETGEKVRGYVRRSALSGASQSIDLYKRADVKDYVSCTAEYVLNLPKDALADGMQVYPLADGTYLIAYRCEGSDKLWMRVISEKGKKLFAKSVPELYLSQITLTDSGFICEAYDNSEIDSGMRYTYTCKGSKWSSKKVKYIDDPDRYYSHNTVNYTLRRYPFGEGNVIPIEIECRTTGSVTRHQMYYGSDLFLCEYEGNLLVHAEDENGVLCVRMYDSSGRLTGSTVSPIAEPISGAVANPDAVYFYTPGGYGPEWESWRLDMTTLAFDAEPLTIAAPVDCTLIPITSTKPYQLVRMDTEFTSILCDVTNKGEMLQVSVLYGRAIWSGETEEGFLLLLQNAEEEFILQHYAVMNE